MPTKILVADDSATMRRVLEMTFAGEDARVMTVDSADAALTKAAELSPDVVFADASLPGVDGYELARRIKTNPALSKIAVIVMASQHNPYDDGKGRAAGVDDHISKPFDTASVIDRVTQVLAKPRSAPSGAHEPVAKPAAAAAAPAARPMAVAAGPSGNSPAAAGRTAPQATRMGIGGPMPIQAPVPAKPAVPAPQPAPAQARPVAAPMAAGGPAAPMAVARPAPAPVAAPRPAAAPASAVVTAATTDLAGKLNGLGLTREQVEGVLALSREIIEQVVWEVVPDLAEQLIKEEIKRLTAE